MDNSMCSSLQYHTEYFHCPKNPLCSAELCSHPPTHLFIFSFLECHIVGIVHYVALSDWLLSLSNVQLKSSMSVHGLIDHFFLAWSNVPLSGCTTLYLSIHQLKGILVASMFGTYE